MTTWQNVGKTLVRNPDWDITSSMVACQPGGGTYSMESPHPFWFSGILVLWDGTLKTHLTVSPEIDCD
jgi:hypothetical protein